MPVALGFDARHARVGPIGSQQAGIDRLKLLDLAAQPPVLIAISDFGEPFDERHAGAFGPLSEVLVPRLIANILRVDVQAPAIGQLRQIIEMHAAAVRIALAAEAGEAIMRQKIHGKAAVLGSAQKTELRADIQAATGENRRVDGEVVLRSDVPVVRGAEQKSSARAMTEVRKQEAALALAA